MTDYGTSTEDHGTATSVNIMHVRREGKYSIGYLYIVTELLVADSLPSTPSTPSKPVVAATSTPPPINWATKPKAQPATTNEHVHTVQLGNSPSTRRRLIPIYIDPDDIGVLQECILRLATANPLATVLTSGLHQEIEIESPPPQQPTADHEGHTPSKTDDDSLDSTISTLASFTLSSPPTPQVSSKNSVSLSKKSYYVITVGKCAGVFYDEWYVSLSFDGCFYI